MSFTLRIYFEGLLHYVESSSGSDTRLCIVAPNAPDHNAGFEAAKGTMIGGVDGKKLSINRKRIVVQFSGEHPDIKFEGPIMGGHVVGAIAFEKMAGTFSDHNLKVVNRSPLEAMVRSQVLIGGGGTFHLAVSDDPPQLDLPSDLVGGGVPRVTFAEGFFMEAPGIEWARLLELDLVDKVDSYTNYPITTSDGGIAAISLSQTCQVQGHTQLGDEDKDFRQHYMLLNSLPPGRTIENMPAPIIHKFSGAAESFLKDHPPLAKRITADGCDCVGSRGLKRSLSDLDKFMNIQPTS